MQTFEHTGLYNLMVDMLYKDIGHGLRKPVNDILGLTELLIHEEFSGRKNKEILKGIRSNGMEMIQQIDNLVLFGKLNNGKVKVERKACDINSLVSRLFDKYYQRYISKGNHSINLTSRIPREGEKAYIDNILLERVMGVLIDNAIKNTSRGHVEIGYDYYDTGIIFYVKDTGTGIPLNEQLSIFNSFYRCQDEKNKKYKGAGLGLTIGRELVSLMNGDLWLRSSPAKGTCVYFSIPVLFNHHLN